MAKRKEIKTINWGEPEAYCRELENGNILYFPTIPFEFPKEEIDFLLNQKQTGAKNRKNIAYKPLQDKISNHDSQDAESEKKLHEILRNFSNRTLDFLGKLLRPYKDHWKVDYASFRPFQEKSRKLRLRARNDLLHTDAFPTRPLNGARILRFFININPEESRHWITSSSFEDLAEQFGGSQVPFPANDWVRYGVFRDFKRILRKMGCPLAIRSPYDQFMLRMHHFLKENWLFQKNCQKDHWQFPPGSCWAVFTDQVSHAALSGQYALEQTLLIDSASLLSQETSPLKVLERLSQRKMTDEALSV